MIETTETNWWVWRKFAAVRRRDSSGARHNLNIDSVVVATPTIVNNVITRRISSLKTKFSLLIRFKY